MAHICDDNIIVHYELYDNSTHVIDAKVEAESSVVYVRAMNYVSKLLSVSNELKTGSLRQGSVVKIFWFDIQNKEDSKVLQFILSFVFRRIFFEKKVIELEDLTKECEDEEKACIEKALSKYGIDEIKIKRLNAHLHLKKARSEYFKQISSCKNIKAISIKRNDIEHLENVDLRISRSEFPTYIEEFLPETKIDDNAKVYIISPVIVKGKTLKWNGSYNGVDIRFEILSNQFKTESQNAEINFRTGFFIKCRLQYEETFNEDEKPIHSNYKVLEVYGHGCDDDYTETPAGKKKRINDNQPTLFDELKDW